MTVPEGFTINRGVPDGFTVNKPEQEQDDGFIRDLDAALMKIPGVPTLAEFGAGMARGTAGIIDFFGPDTINEVFRIAGSERRVPTARESMQQVGLAPDQGEFAGDGMVSRMAGSAGEVVPAAVATGSLMRQGAAMLPQFGRQGVQTAPQAQSAVQGTVRALAQGPASPAGLAAQDVGYGVASSAGADLGREVGGAPGEIIGSMAGPAIAMTATNLARSGLRRLFSSPQGVQELRNTLTGLDNPQAARLLAEQMQREGIGPDDVAQILRNLGDEAMPADAGPQFRALLRAAADEVPRIQAQVTDAVMTRQSGQMQRIIGALDETMGAADMDQLLGQLDEVSKPVIDNLYANARQRGYQVPSEVARMFGMRRVDGAWVRQSGEGVSSRMQAIWREAGERMNMRRAAGETPGNLEFIDQLKRTMDDRISTAFREGNNDLASTYLGAKRRLLSDVDQMIPEYAQARRMFSTKAELENAADLGLNYFRMRPKEIRQAMADMSDAQKQLFRSGVRESIVAKAETIQSTSDARKLLFGRNGDGLKLAEIFPDREQLDAFQNQMMREMEFTITKNAVTSNSFTNRFQRGTDNARQAVEAITEAGSGPIGAMRSATRVISNLGNARGQAAYEQALADAGDFLVSRGLDPEGVAQALREGNRENISNLLKTVQAGRYSGPLLRSSIAQQFGGE